jgi:MFS family permease
VTQEPVEAAERVVEAERRRKSWVIDVRPLRVVAYRRMWLGNGVSFFGYQFTSVAVPVQMFAITHSSAWVGLLGIAALIPLMIFGLWGGAAADVVDRRRLLLISSSIAWAGTAGFLCQ